MNPIAKLTLFTICLLATVSFSFSSNPSSSYTIDVEVSKVLWKGYKITGSHTGELSLSEGTLEFEDDVLIGGSFQIDMTTMTCTDIKGKKASNLVGHLQSADFFNVQEHPHATFEITKVVSRGKAGDYKIIGDLTIKGTTNSIRFNATVHQEGDALTAQAEITVDRSDFDVRYGSGSFFDNLGEKTIYDEFDLQVSLVTK